MLSRVFIDRPIFAWVLAILVMLLGVGAINLLPIAQYPDIAPPQVVIRATYPGASAQTVENAVTQIIEQQLSGIDGLLYFQSQSSSRGSVSITATFAKGTNPDIAQVQVQNQVQQGVSRLPAAVQQQGLVVRKSNADFLLIVALFDKTGNLTNADIADYMVSNLQDALGRLPGVGDLNVFGTQYAMRIWLDPSKLASFSLIPDDVIGAIEAQNADISAGELGSQPQPAEQMLSATVTSQSRLQTAEQFRAIILRTLPSGASVRISDVARVELGQENYNNLIRINGHPGTGLAISLAPGADALTTAETVKNFIAQRAPGFPQGVDYAFVNDTTNFIKLSIEEVVKTLIEAIVLVIIVMFVFLQSWRATLVPTIAVPVVLLGTFAVFYLAGFSINSLTLFGLVLAIGLLVDDAIIVVENVERLMEENPEMSPRDATIESMEEISVALIAIALVLSAVFLPMAFFGGSTGVIYRQFAVTMVSAMVLSVLVALILSPALTSHLLKQKRRDGDGSREGWLVRTFPRASGWVAAGRDKFNYGFARGIERYERGVRTVVERKWLFLLVYAGAVALLVVLFLRLPTGFLPTEDQGGLQLSYQLPPGSTQSRTFTVSKALEKYMLTYEKNNVATMFTNAGGGAGGGPSGQNTGGGYIQLSDWAKRGDARDSADAIVKRANSAFQGFRDARVFVLVPPAARGLGQADGFTMELRNTSGMSTEKFRSARDKLYALAMKDPAITTVRITELADVPALNVQLDTEKLAALGLTQANVNSTLSTAWGGSYVNDFIDRGRVKRVYVEGDSQFRALPQDINQWYVRSSTGEMAPFGAFSTLNWSQASPSLARFSGTPSYEFQGSAAPGRSSGDAMTAISKLAEQVPGTSVAWAGISYQERLSSGQAPLLYALSLLVVFLCLAALYESWSIPVAVLLVIPLGLVGAIVAVTLRGLQNDVYLQIGLLTTMGLAAKNAILMIEFAERAEKQGKRVIDAAIEAARIRLRPILMTSFAFIFGVLPLALASGAGANSRIEIGTAVVGGMLTATILAVFYIPLFFVLVRRGVRDGINAVRRRLGKRDRRDRTDPPAPDAGREGSPA